MFLKRAADAVACAGNKHPSSLNINKVLAGAEPEATNAFLQEMAVVAQSHGGARFAEVLQKLKKKV
jgi:hypothetical protein